MPVVDADRTWCHALPFGEYGRTPPRGSLGTTLFTYPAGVASHDASPTDRWTLSQSWRTPIWPEPLDKVGTDCYDRPNDSLQDPTRVGSARDLVYIGVTCRDRSVAGGQAALRMSQTRNLKSTTGELYPDHRYAGVVG